jgi:hypothetical protein
MLLQSGARVVKTNTNIYIYYHFPRALRLMLLQSGARVVHMESYAEKKRGGGAVYVRPHIIYTHTQKNWGPLVYIM